jgi:hypothetical protein
MLSDIYYKAFHRTVADARPVDDDDDDDNDLNDSGREPRGGGMAGPERRGPSQATKARPAEPWDDA